MKYVLAWFACLALVPASTFGDKAGDKARDDKAKAASTKIAPELDADDVKDIPSFDLRVEKDEHRRYLLAGPRPNEKVPKAGFGLFVIMPGGTGEANFHPFVKRIYKNAVPDGFLVVQPIAPKWTDDQTVVWPTEKVRATGMKVPCDDFVEQVIAEVKTAHKIDPERAYTLSWSSSGPLAYLLSTRKKGAVRGSFIAMSVFDAKWLDLDQVKGKPYYLYHSKEDKTCAFAMAEEARDTLKKKGAVVEFQTYAGGHGWFGDMFGDMRKGFDWLVKQK